jgi:hypothetical protein
MKAIISIVVVCLTVLTHVTHAQGLNTRREIEKANKETFPEAVKKIEAVSGTAVTMEVDTASYGDDEKAWSNLYIIVNRVVGAIEEVGKDKIGKEALAKGVKKIVIVKTGKDAKEDAAELKDGTLTVKTSAYDDSGYTIQGVVQTALEKAL